MAAARHPLPIRSRCNRRRARAAGRIAAARTRAGEPETAESIPRQASRELAPEKHRLATARSGGSSREGGEQTVWPTRPGAGNSPVDRLHQPAGEGFPALRAGQRIGSCARSVTVAEESRRPPTCRPGRDPVPTAQLGEMEPECARSLLACGSPAIISSACGRAVQIASKLSLVALRAPGRATIRVWLETTAT